MATHSQRSFGERLIASPWRFILFPLWLLYRPIIGLRNMAYDLKWFHSKKLAAPVISIGNIIAGGSGKTPMVALLINALPEYAIHVLSRGYKGDGEQNDEAQLITAPVHCNSNRYAAGKQAIESGAKALLLDDGFQHRQLHRDLDVVLIDCTRPWGFPQQRKGAVLPLGFLRESLKALKRADILVLTRCDQCDKPIVDRLQQRLQALNKPLFKSQHQAQYLLKHNSDDQLDLNTLTHGKWICVAGIAHPQAFIDTVHSLGASIEDSFQFADHYHFKPSDIQSINHKAKSANECSVICTSKDYVKLKSLWPADAAPLYVLEIALSLDKPEDFLKHIQQAIGN